MNRTALSLKMLQILQSYGKVSKRELAELLETKERNIYEYKKELETAGYHILSTPGINGGYSLNEKYILKTPALSPEDEESLFVLLDYLRKDQSIIGTSRTKESLTKVCSSLKGRSDQVEEKVIRTNTSRLSHERIQAYYTQFHYAIQNKMKVTVDYESFNKRSIKRLHPYALCDVNNFWYLIAYDEESQMYKVFKLNRMKEVVMLMDKYWPDPNFKQSDYIDDVGFNLKNQTLRIKLKLTGIYKKALQEVQIGKKVVIEVFDDYILYEADIRGDIIIRELILKMGSDCEVIEPQVLKEQIRDEIELMLAPYR